VKGIFGAIVGLALAAGACFIFSHYEIRGLDSVLRPKAAPLPERNVGLGQPGGAPTITVGSFNIQVFGQSKLSKPEVMQALAQIARKFDVLAIQEIRSKSQDVLPKFVALINATGAKYDFVIGPPLGRTTSKEQYAFIYDTATVELDPDSVYTVDDPDDLLHREPLVAGFRVRGPQPNEAFTFTLVNIHTDPDETRQELNALDDVFRAVQRDGRGEDDVILLGDLNVDERNLGELGAMSNIVWAISNQPTNTRGDKTYDNLVFHHAATGEYTGRAGVFDMRAAFNLTLEQALEISDHQPVWAEFTAREGGAGGRVANVPGTPAR
jgi:deoxyribonuclease-1-like protein